eukprot:TCONS_00045856-protein
MLMFKVTCIVVILVIVQSAAFNDEKESENKRMRRDAGLTAALIGAGISAGASLVGTTVGALKRSDYSVAVSGSITNFAKWNMGLKQCVVESGYMNIPMRSVSSGKREGFAGHKEGNTATGNWVQCTYKILNSNVIIHLMYSAPFSFDFHYNQIAVAICHSSDSRCTNMKIGQMTNDARPYLARMDYYNTIRMLKLCKEGFCVTGVMGTSHHSEITWKVYPIIYDNLSNAVQSSAAKTRWDKADYDHFVVKELM